MIRKIALIAGAAWLASRVFGKQTPEQGVKEGRFSPSDAQSGADVDATGRPSAVEVRPDSPLARCFAKGFGGLRLQPPPKRPSRRMRTSTNTSVPSASRMTRSISPPPRPGVR